MSASSQTDACIDTPYAISAALPPLFGSKVCVQTKPIFMSKSVPNLLTLHWVDTSEEDIIQEAAEEALSSQYDFEVSNFYEDARRTAAASRNVL